MSSPQQARHASPHSPTTGSPSWARPLDVESIDSNRRYVDPILANTENEYTLQDYSNDMHGTNMNLLDQCDARYSNSLLLDPHDVLNSQSRLTAFGEPPATPEMYTRLPHDINPSHGHGYPRIRVNTSALPSPAILPVDLYSTQCLPSSPLLDSTGGGYGSFPLTPSTASSTSPLRNTLEVPQRAPISPSLLSHSFWSQGSTQMPMPPSPYLPTPAYSPSEQPLLTFGDGTMVPGLPHHPIHTVLDLARQFPFTGVILPQRTYRPHTQSDRRRYVEEVELEEPIMFIMGSPDACGISCRDALNSKFMRLMGRDDQMFVNRGPSVSIRLCWPGYAPWSRQIPTRDFRTPPGPITRSKLAKNVAKTVFRFIEDMQNRPMEEDSDHSWKVGGNKGIKIDQLELLGLQHVSMGSWQVHLRVRSRV